jgi:trehalose 6-phosphate synthase
LGQFSFDTENWNIYQDVNLRFAQKVAEVIDDDSIVWIHDYQLFYVGYYLRELGVKAHLNFFLHIPFPAVDLFRRLPWNRELLLAVLSHDHVGFQTPNDRRNFIACIKWFLPEAARSVRKRRSEIKYENRTTLVGYYPISIDFNEFADGSATREAADAAWYLRENIKAPVLALGLDRLDYTKGIPERFLAFERMLEKYPSAIGKISLLQIVVPSRLNVPDYQDLKTRLDGLSGRINARFSQQGWVPILYQFRELDRTQLLGHYRASDIALITPLRDGMNLVAKEYCASNIDETGVLVLSEFAGAAYQLAKGAILVNPYDLDVTADAIYAAFIMTPEEKRHRMRILRSGVKKFNLKKWVDWFFGSSPSNDLPSVTKPDREEILT